MEKKEFVCDGCGKLIAVDESIPEQRLFTWTGATDGVEHDYCSECDWLLIQDQPLPRDRGRK